MRTTIETHSEIVDTELNQDFQTIFSGCDKTEEQEKYIQSSCSSSIRYPIIITFCLNLATWSSSANFDLYDNKTGSVLLVLSSLWSLRDYKNYIHPTQGFNPTVFGDLQKKIINFSRPERFITILFDEMKIQEYLVWDKYSGELIGFVDLDDTLIQIMQFLEM